MKIAVCVAGLIAVSQTAVLADEMTNELLGYSWSGAYAGIQGGYAWGDGDVQLSAPARIFPHFPAFRGFGEASPSSLSGGFYAGINHQFRNRLVVGIEADALWSGADDASSVVTSTGLVFGTLDSRMNWGASLRARAGYSFDRWMPYVSGGLALANVEHVAQNTGTLEFKETYKGWTAGIGADYAFTDNLILRGSYRYSDFRPETFKFGSLTVESDLSTHDLQFGVAYKF